MSHRFFSARSISISEKRTTGTGIKHLASGLLLLLSLFSLSCNQPFQPEVDYKPKLVMYAVLFSNDTTVNVRLTSTSKTADNSVNNSVHGADVFIVGSVPYYDPSDSTYKYRIDTVTLVESTIVVGGDSASFYTGHLRIVGGHSYWVQAEKTGFNPVSAGIVVPTSLVSVPTPQVYSILRQPSQATSDPVFDITLSYYAVAWFPQIYIEYRGFDTNGQLHVGYVSLVRPSGQDPFTQLSTLNVSFAFSRELYANQLKAAQQLVKSLTLSHIYVDVIVTQVNDPLYRFYLTSGRWGNPLAMRTDKVIFSNINGGSGILGAAAVDTTRIYLY